MTSAKRNEARVTRAMRQYVLLVVLYVALLFLLPVNSKTSATYHMTVLQHKFVLLAVAIPSLFVWLAAFFSYAKLRQYAYAISKTPEGAYFDKLATGCAWLAWSLPITTIIPAVLNGIANHNSGFHPTAIIISNYLSLVFPLIAFSIIAHASRGLLSTTKVKLSLTNSRLIVSAFLIAGVLYCFLTFRHFDLSSLASTSNPYFLPLWLMVITVTVPYLYAWFVGLLASYEISLYSMHVPGVLYRRALRYVAGGLVAVILSSIALQYLNGVEPRVGHLVFNYRLYLTMLFRIIGGGGFVLLAMGAQRLKKIEEV